MRKRFGLRKPKIGLRERKMHFISNKRNLKWKKKLFFSIESSETYLNQIQVISTISIIKIIIFLNIGFYIGFKFIGTIPHVFLNALLLTKLYGIGPFNQDFKRRGF